MQSITEEKRERKQAEDDFNYWFEDEEEE